MHDTLTQTIALLARLFEQYKVDDSHGKAHALAVYTHTLKAFTNEPPTIQLICALSALLHDADDRKYFQSTDYDNARAIMRECNIAADDQNLVVHCIGLVSCSVNGNYIPSGVSQWMLYARWSDRLEAIGRVGIWRCYAYTLHIKRPLFCEDTPRPTTEEELDAVAPPARFANYVALNGKVGSSSFIDHFYDKLLHIGVLEGCTNAYLLEEAANRVTIMREFVLEFGRMGRMPPILREIIKEFS